MNTRRYIPAVAVVAVVLILTGCTPRDKASVRLQGDRLEIVPCQTIVADKVLTYVRPDGQRTTAQVWSLNGKGTFDPDHPLTYGVEPQGFTSDSGPVAFDYEHSFVSVSFYPLEPSSSGVGKISLAFDGVKLVPGKWLRSDGTVSASPCG